MIATFPEDRSVLNRSARPPDYSVRYGSHADNVADVWEGTGFASQRALVVMIHGGFWRPDYDRSHTAPLCEAIAHAGWTIATLEYRREPGRPDVTIDDIRAAVTAVPALVQGHNGRIILIGHSAGGHLGLHLAATGRATALTAAIALAPAADLQRVESLNLDNGATRDFLGGAVERRPDLDPAQLPDIGCASVILHGHQDVIVPISVSQAYVARHPLTRLVDIDQCGHFALIDPLSPAWRIVIDELQRLG